MEKRKPVPVSEEEIVILLEKEGCPAENDLCTHLINGYCSLKNPKLYHRLVKSDGYACASCSF